MASLLESLVGLDTLERWNERAQREEAAREGVAYTPPEKREAWRALVP